MPYDNSRGYFRDEDDFPGPAHDGRGRALARRQRRLPRPLLPLRRRVRPARAVRHAGAVRLDVRRHVGGPAPDLAAVRATAPSQRACSPSAQAHQVRACYGAKLTMIDAWFGRVLDAIDRNELWDDTAVIVCTDHGHYLGEKDIWGKPGVPVYEPLGHIPLMVAWPGVEAGASRRADHERRHLRDAGRPLRRRRPSTARTASRWCRCSRGEATSRARVRALRRLGPRGAPDRRTPQVRPRAGGRQRAALDVVEPLVDDAGTVAPDAPPAAPGRPRATLDRMPGIEGAGDPPAVRAGRPAAVLGDGPVQRQPPLRPATTTRPRTRTSPARSASASTRIGYARRCARSRRRRISSSGWGSRKRPLLQNAPVGCTRQMMHLLLSGAPHLR